MNVSIFGHGNPVRMIIESLKGSDVKVIHVNQDFYRKGEEQSAFSFYLAQEGIGMNNWHAYKEQTDMIFVINYNKIIDLNKYNNTHIVNLHMGLLPKYRGNNANAWAVINNEKVVGYTLHAVEEMLDAGDIYYRFSYPVKLGDTYLEAKKAINKDIQQNLSDILMKIFKGEIKGESQKNDEFIYCSKLRPIDGIITEWNVKTRDILNKMYVFSKPLGTGLKFRYKGKVYTIESMDKIDGFSNSKGIPGGIVYIYKNALWVKTKDTAVALKKITLDGDEIDIQSSFKIGQRLGD